MLFSTIRCTQTADLIIFSYDRPLQLYALLESTEKCITGLQEVHVIYRTSNQAYKQAYEKVKKRFNTIIYWEQGSHPRKDFKPLTLKAAFESPSEYIIFAVDDIIVKDFIDIHKSITVLKKTNAYGLYFRLGLHLTRCYPLNCNQQVPPCMHIQDDIYAWYFTKGKGDWGYPNTVDMTLYRKKDIEATLKSISYWAPNTLEGWWGSRGLRNIKRQPIGLCYKESKIVNLPLNRVHKIGNNRTMNAFFPKELLDIFNQGLKIDIDALFKTVNESAHMDYIPKFIKRKKPTT